MSAPDPVAATLHALAARLGDAHRAAVEACRAADAGEVRQAVGTLAGVGTLLAEAAALHAAAGVLHREAAGRG